MAQERRPSAKAACNSARERRFVQGLDQSRRAAPTRSTASMHALVQHFGKHDVAVEQSRSCLSGDAQRIAEAARDDQQRALALALEQRVGGDRGAHLHAGHALRRDRFPRREPQQPTGCLRPRHPTYCDGFSDSSLRCAKKPSGRAADDVGERAAPIDPELPAPAHLRGVLRRSWAPACTHRIGADVVLRR